MHTVCLFFFYVQWKDQSAGTHTHKFTHQHTEQPVSCAFMQKHPKKKNQLHYMRVHFHCNRGRKECGGWGGGKSCLTISIWVAESVAPQPSQQYIPLHRFLCCGMKWGHFPCRLLKAEWQQASDVEDPRRSALKDSRRVWREFGPHQMFLQDR